MKYTLLIPILLLTACSDKSVTNNYIEVEYIEVTLSARSMIEVSEQAFMAKAVTDHEIPTDFTAYFVAEESRGEYSSGQVVKMLDVNSGLNDITIPKMSYTIYITNYDQSGVWYTWPDAIEQLPQSSDSLYLYGAGSIDYGETDYGEVEVHNPYAAVMIADNEWLDGTPKFYGTGQEYTVMGSWYNLYIRGDNTNTEVPISIAGNPNQVYTLDRDIEANKIYQFTVNGNVIEDEGSLNIVTQPMEQGYEEEIRL